jgi:hypothetical protein
VRLALRVLPGVYAICRLPADAGVPDWAQGEWLSITRTPDELSIVCEQARVPTDVQADHNWRRLQVQGPLDLALIGILAALTAPLAQVAIDHKGSIRRQFCQARRDGIHRHQVRAGDDAGSGLVRLAHVHHERRLGRGEQRLEVARRNLLRIHRPHAVHSSLVRLAHAR